MTGHSRIVQSTSSIRSIKRRHVCLLCQTFSLVMKCSRIDIAVDRHIYPHAHDTSCKQLISSLSLHAHTSFIFAAVNVARVDRTSLTETLPRGRDYSND